MDIYNIWADKKGDIDDGQWVTNMKAFLQQLVDEGMIDRKSVV